MVQLKDQNATTTNGSIGRLECHNNEMVLLEDQNTTTTNGSIGRLEHHNNKWFYWKIRMSQQ